MDDESDAGKKLLTKCQASVIKGRCRVLLQRKGRDEKGERSEVRGRPGGSTGTRAIVSCVGYVYERWSPSMQMRTRREQTRKVKRRRQRQTTKRRRRGEGVRPLRLGRDQICTVSVSCGTSLSIESCLTAA
jgi:hypothetical protein